MSWSYSQSTGEFIMPDGTLKGFGFAGHKQGLNNPACQMLHDIGPLPQGTYSMTQWIDKHHTMGLCVIQLTPAPANSMFGRSGFFIHGARNLLISGLNSFLESSDGCIIIGDCTLRKAIWDSMDRTLVVTA